MSRLAGLLNELDHAEEKMEPSKKVLKAYQRTSYHTKFTIGDEVRVSGDAIDEKGESVRAIVYQVSAAHVTLQLFKPNGQKKWKRSVHFSDYSKIKIVKPSKIKDARSDESLDSYYRRKSS